jgi:hypothetical protein
VLGGAVLGGAVLGGAVLGGTVGESVVYVGVGEPPPPPPPPVFPRQFTSRSTSRMIRTIAPMMIQIRLRDGPAVPVAGGA